jgi:hypothetical protein
MEPDVNMKQFADIKLLLPTITDALNGGQGFTLNMIGPINIGGPGGNRNKDKTKCQQNSPTLIERSYISSDDIFAEDFTMADFARRAKLSYFKIIATRHKFDRHKLGKILDLSSQSLHTYAREAGIKFVK